MSDIRSLPHDRSHVLTEQRNPRSAGMHDMSAAAIAGLMNDEDVSAVSAVRHALSSIVAFIEAVEPRFIDGGRLIYVGAGTSGRLGVLDASECPPTFCVESGRVIGIIAGGDSSLRKSSEGLEDDPEGARRELESLNLDERDSVLGIAAGGTTPYVLGALSIAKSWGAAGRARVLTGLLTCATVGDVPNADHVMVMPTGPEVLTGSTRLKAGTATKLALNTMSTALMVRSGRVYQNLMVDVRAANDKLRDRAARIIVELTGLQRDESLDLLHRAGGSAKTAIVMHRRGVERAAAESLIAGAGGRLGDVLKDVSKSRL
jgi:N-acetylmuramic acid 6-phosphate etherase